MVPMPAGGDDLPQSEDGLGPSPPLALTVSSTDEEDEEQTAADAGYQPLPLGEPDDDSAGDSETEAGNAAEASSASAEALTSDIVLHSSHLPLVHNSYEASIFCTFLALNFFNELQHLVVALENQHIHSLISPVESGKES